MVISKKEVQQVAELARLKLSPAEVKKFQEELSAILGYLSQLQKVNTKDVSPTFQTTGLKNVWRDDRIEKPQQLSAKQALANAPEQENGSVRVKPVF
ncbi:Asp-tRNA(Asn)/Glu-tRNA(Gln) amidotransferase subunit GatC [Candidatus Parcubacteria bacterium]|nr:Asp-tRNA(Asn)/Glu-tRNA(Gln) amidotransferase subunit GatC [Candidatus Parcubacteria bacterium]